MPPRSDSEKSSTSTLLDSVEGKTEASGTRSIGGAVGGYHRRRRKYLLLLLLFPLYYYFFLPTSSISAYEFPLGPPLGNLTFSPTPSRRIPPYVHYVLHGVSPDHTGRPFGFIYFLTFSSALVVLKPEVIYFHYVYPPSGWWWEQMKARIENSETTKLKMVKQRDVTEIFGRKVEKLAHKADVIRLEVLRDYGGIYLDTDMFVLRDFKPFYHLELVMAVEAQPFDDPDVLPPAGLSNAVILSKPFSSFIARWFDTYKSFDLNKWAEHSIAMPWALAQQFPSELTVLNKFAFVYPGWHDPHLDLVHRSVVYKWTPQQFTYHLWESGSWHNYLCWYDPDRVHISGSTKDGVENTFTRLVRDLVGEELRKDWREAVRDGLVDPAICKRKGNLS